MPLDFIGSKASRTLASTSGYFLLLVPIRKICGGMGSEVEPTKEARRPSSARAKTRQNRARGTFFACLFASAHCRVLSASFKTGVRPKNGAEGLVGWEHKQTSKTLENVMAKKPKIKIKDLPAGKKGKSVKGGIKFLKAT
jgi:hypothetical protein